MRNMYLSSFGKNLFSLLAVVFLSVFFDTAQAQEVFVSTPDGIAGETVQTRVSGLAAYEEATLSLERPDGSNLSLNAEADELGIINMPIPSLHTQRQGDYKVSVFRDFAVEALGKSEFSISAGPISAFRSNITLSSPSIPADGKMTTDILISAKDTFGNAIKNKPVKVFSSRNEDHIVMQKNTDNQGLVSGKISSKTAGISTISALIEETLIFEKPQLVFHITEKSAENIGSEGFGQYLKASLFETGNVQSNTEYFTIEGLNPELTKDNDLTVRVIAKDANGNIDKNYLGTVRFSVTDTKAKLPVDYTFTAEDQGVHTFYLAVSFGTLGQQTLSVLDVDDFRISGELGINVHPNDKEGSGTQNNTGNTNAKVHIDIPTDGSRFSSSRVTVGGTSNNCTAVKLTDGPTVLIEKLGVDSDGGWTYQTPALADGYHEFLAYCHPDNSVISNKVGIFIDRTAPTVMAVEINPATTLSPGEGYEITVGSSEELSNAECTINNETIAFQAIDDKTFRGQGISPLATGVYPVSCSIFDLLGNELSEPNSATLTINDLAPSAPTEPAPEIVPPSAVSNLSAKPGDNKVTLFWSPAKDVKGIKNYQVAFALFPETLRNNSQSGNNPLSNASNTPIENNEEGSESESADRQNSTGNLNNDKNFQQARQSGGKNLAAREVGTNTTPDARTQWYIDDLKACTKYYFQVTPVNLDGITGTASNIVEGTPLCDDQPAVTPPKTGGDNQTLAIILGLLAGGFVLLFFRKKA